jgi:hypothetical protein
MIKLPATIAELVVVVKKRIGIINVDDLFD